MTVCKKSREKRIKLSVLINVQENANNNISILKMTVFLYTINQSLIIRGNFKHPEIKE